MIGKLIKAVGDLHLIGYIHSAIQMGLSLNPSPLYSKFTVSNEDISFYFFNQWVETLPEYQKVKNLKVKTFDIPNDELDRTRLSFVPMSSLILVDIWGTKIIISKQEYEAKAEEATSRNYTKKEEFTIYCLAKDHDLVKSKVEEVCKSDQTDPVVNIYMPNYNSWSLSSIVSKRSYETLHLPGNTFQDLVGRITSFKDSKDWYKTNGIPHRMGLVFEGLPGTGKTTTITALASYFNWPIYLVPANSAFDDKTFMKMISNVPENSFLVFEDMDGLFPSREGNESKKSSISFSAILNSLDGITSSEGRVLIMTTNHVEKLDPALIRPGRIDHVVTFTHAVEDQIISIFTKFYSRPELSAVFSAEIKDFKVTVAQLQNYLLLYKTDPIGCLNNAKEYFRKESNS